MNICSKEEYIYIEMLWYVYSYEACFANLCIQFWDGENGRCVNAALFIAL